MSNDKARAHEGGMIRALLGYQLLHMADEDLVLFVRNDNICFTLDNLMDSGWVTLDAIYSCDSEESDDHVLLTYYLNSNNCQHKTIAVQVLINRYENWHSVGHIFHNANYFEEIIMKEKYITFI